MIDLTRTPVRLRPGDMVLVQVEPDWHYAVRLAAGDPEPRDEQGNKIPRQTIVALLWRERKHGKSPVRRPHGQRFVRR